MPGDPFAPCPRPCYHPPGPYFPNRLNPDRDARAMETLAAAINRLVDALEKKAPTP